MKSNLLDKMYENNKANFAGTIVSKLLSVMMSTYAIKFLQTVIDLGTNGTNKDIAIKAVTGTLFIILLVIVELVKRYYKNTYYKKAITQLKTEMFQRLTQKNISTFQNESTAEYISAFTNDINSIHDNYLVNTVENLIGGVVAFVCALYLMLDYDILFTIITIGIMVFSFSPTLIVGRPLPKMEEDISNENSKFTSLVKDLLGGFPVIKNFRIEERVIRLFEDENERLEVKKNNRRRKCDVIGLVGGSTGFAVQLFVILAGTFFVLAGKLTTGTVVAFLELGGQVLGAVQVMPAAWANRKAALQLLHKAEKNLAVNVNTTHVQPIEKNGTGITFDNVSFAYEDGNTVLRDVNLKLEHGKSYAIVGASGSGKTTLINLLLGGFDNYTGSIRINGQEIRTASYDSLYELIAVVWQNVFIFDSTIEENVTMFKKYSDDKMKDVIDKAQLNALVSGKGLQYQCGENGSQLSGGEKQRISIARCLLQDTDVLILDEATSALDAETAQYVEEMIKNLQGMMRIVITHKLNPDVLRNYDNVIVLKDGTVDGFGTYDELWDGNEYFRKLMEITL